MFHFLSDTFIPKQTFNSDKYNYLQKRKKSRDDSKLMQTYIHYCQSDRPTF